MLQTIRDRASGWFAYIIIGLLIVPFALWGINHYTNSGPTTDAATVDGDPITLAQFQQALQRQRQRVAAALGADAVDEGRLKREVMDGLIDEKLLERFVGASGLRVSDLQVDAAIKGIAAFQVNGSFSHELYERTVRSQGYTVPAFESMLRASLATDQLRQGVAVSAVLTAVDLRRLVDLIGQKREVSYLVMPKEAFRAREQPGEPDIEAFYQQHRDRYVNPEQVRLEYIDLNAEALGGNVAPSEEALRAAYHEQQASFSRPEERVASHILVRLPEDASAEQVERARVRIQGLADDIAAGRKTFDDVSRSIREGGDPTVEAGELGALAKGVMDPAFDEALFGLAAPGAISAPVRTDFGYHLVRLDAIRPAQVKPYEEVRDELVRTLNRQQNDGRFYEAAERLSTLAFENPDTLVPAAQAVGVTVVQSDWLSRQGADTGIFADPKVLAAAFSDDVLGARRNSEPIQIDAGRAVVIRVLDHKAASQRTLDEAREQVLGDLREERAYQRMNELSGTYAERVRSGESLQALASEGGYRVEAARWAQRNAPGVDPALLRAAFRLPPPAEGKPAATAVDLANGDRAVLMVSAVKPGTEADLAEGESKLLTDRIRGQIGAVQLEGMVDEWRRQSKVVSHVDRL